MFKLKLSYSLKQIFIDYEKMQNEGESNINKKINKKNNKENQLDYNTINVKLSYISL